MPAACRVGDPMTCGDTMANGSPNVFVNNIAVSRLGIDLTAGHCFPPVPVVSASPNVFINGIAVDRVGDPHPGHCCLDVCHGGSVAAGSPNVFINDGGGGSAGFESLSPQEKVIITGKFATKQPGANVYVHSATITDDEDQDGVTIDAPNQQYRQTAAKMENVDENAPVTVEKSNTTTPPPAPGPVSANCGDISSHTGPFPGSFQLSPNFTLAMVTTNTLVSNYAIRAQQGLTEQQIVCNLRTLCVNVLEPLRAKYGFSMRINSGFRHGTNNSQHNKGQAVDISFTDISGTEAMYQRAIEVRDLFNYDQFIYEQNNSTWYHLSYKSSGNRRKVNSKPRGTTYYAGIQKFRV